MDEKIINFLEKAKDKTGELLPVEKEQVVKHLDSISSEIAKDYIEFMGIYADNILTLRSVISLAANPQARQRLIDGMNQTQLDNLRTVALDLSSKDALNKTDAVRKASCNIVFPTQESVAKATSLINLLESLDVNYLTLSKNLRLFADTLIVRKLGKEFCALMLDKLSELQENDLDQMIGIVSTVVNNK